MAAILPFANSLPQSLQVPVMQPQFDQIQQVAQKANTIFETGLNQVKNNYSSVINAPVTSSRNLQKKQEYVQSFRDGLKKITKENLSMPQNVVQAENLLSPFWQDQVMLTDMSLTSALQTEMGKYSQAANSSDEKVRASANPDSLEDLNNYAEKLRNAGDNLEDYTSLGAPKYLPYDSVSNYMTDLMIKDKDDNNITVTDRYARNQDGSYARDGKGDLIPLPAGYLITQTNGVQALPTKTHLAATRIGDRFNAQYDLKAKNLYNRSVKAVKQQYPELSDSDAENIVNREFYNTVKEPIVKQLDAYTGAIDAYKSRIKTLEQQASSSTGATQKQLDDLAHTKLLLQDAEQNQIQLHNTLSDVERSAGKVTKGFIINRLSYNNKYQDIKEWGETMAYKNVKSELKKDDTYFSTLEANDRRYGHELTRQKNVWDMQHNRTQDMISIANSLADNPELAGYYAARGIDVSGIMSTLPGHNGLPVGASVSGASTNTQQNVTAAQVQQAAREQNYMKMSHALWGAAGANDPGGMIYAIQDKFTTDEFDALRRYQEEHQLGEKFTPKTEEDRKNYESAIKKLCVITGTDRATITSAKDVTNMIVNQVGANLAQYMKDGVNQNKVALYTNLYTTAKNLHTTIQREDEEQDRMVAELAKRNTDYQRFVVPDSKGGHFVRSEDVPITGGFSGTDVNGRQHKYTDRDLRNKFLNGEIVLDVPTDIGEAGSASYYLPGHTISPKIRIDGVEIRNDNSKEYHELVANIIKAQNRFGANAEDIGRVRGELYSKAVPNERYYKTLTGETDKYVDIPLIGETKVGKNTVGHEENINYLREALMPGNYFTIEDVNGKPISDSDYQLLEQLTRNQKDAAKMLGDNYGYLPSDNLGRSRMMVKVNLRPETSVELKGQYKNLSGKSFYITLSPAAQGTYLSKLRRGNDVQPYDPLLEGKPEYSNNIQGEVGLDSKMYKDLKSGNYIYTGSYSSTDKTTGEITKVPINQVLSGTFTAQQARQWRNELDKNATDAILSTSSIFVQTNGSKVKN